MRCATAEKRLTPYLDDRLGAAERAELEAHLSGCAACRQTHALYAAARTTLAAEGPAEPAPGLAARVANVALAATPRRAPAAAGGDWLRLLRWPALASAGATAALALALFVAAPAAKPPAPADAATAFSQLVSLDDRDFDPLTLGAEVLGEEVE